VRINTSPRYDHEAAGSARLAGTMHKKRWAGHSHPRREKNWRRGPGVRSISDCFARVAGANYGSSAISGYVLPPGSRAKDLRSQQRTRQDHRELNQSFCIAERRLEQANVGFRQDGEKEGRRPTMGDSLLMIVHNHDQGQPLLMRGQRGSILPGRRGPKGRPADRATMPTTKRISGD